MDGFSTLCRARYTSTIISSYRLLLCATGMGTPGVGTVWYRISSEIEVPNHATLRPRAISSVVIGSTASSTQLNLIKNSRCFFLKRDSSDNRAILSTDNFPN